MDCWIQSLYMTEETFKLFQISLWNSQMAVSASIEPWCKHVHMYVVYMSSVDLVINSCSGGKLVLEARSVFYFDYCVISVTNYDSWREIGIVWQACEQDVVPT